jgi:hypothetical protein
VLAVASVWALSAFTRLDLRLPIIGFGSFQKVDFWISSVRSWTAASPRSRMYASKLYFVSPTSVLLAPMFRMLGWPVAVWGTADGLKYMSSSVLMWSAAGAPVPSTGNWAANCRTNCWFCHLGTYLSTQL